MNLLQKLFLFSLFFNHAKMVGAEWCFFYTIPLETTLLSSLVLLDTTKTCSPNVSRCIVGASLLYLPCLFFYAQLRKTAAQTELENQDPAKYDNYPGVRSSINKANVAQQNIEFLSPHVTPEPENIINIAFDGYSNHKQLFDEETENKRINLKNIHEPILRATIKHSSRIQKISVLSFVGTCGIIGYAHLKNQKRNT